MLNYVKTLLNYLKTMLNYAKTIINYAKLCKTTLNYAIFFGKCQFFWLCFEAVARRRYKFQAIEGELVGQQRLV